MAVAPEWLGAMNTAPCAKTWNGNACEAEVPEVTEVAVMFRVVTTAAVGVPDKYTLVPGAVVRVTPAGRPVADQLEIRSEET